LRTPTAVHHIGITVSDLRSSAAWYSEVIGLTPGLRTGGSGTALGELVDVDDPDLRAMFLHIGDVIVELIGYRRPPGRSEVPANNDLGAAHICFEVEDMAAAAEHLRAHGVAFNAPPFTIPAGPLKGSTALYFRDPDGIQLEYFQRAARSAA
jgi:catechol 2,3-dioxygenase-like lactoylglutathione lyase family enzyme